MPIVLSYEDVNTLGTLAYQGGRTAAEAQGRFANKQIAAGIDASRNQTAAQLQGISAQERQGAANRQLQRDLSGQRIAAGQQQQATQLEAAGVNAQAQLEAQIQQELLGAQLQERLSETKQRQKLEQIEREASLGKFTRAGEATGQISREGFPDKRFAQKEVQTYGHLIPFGAGRALDAADASYQQNEALQTAQSLSSLPSSQIQAQLSKNPQSEWSGYLKAVLQSRSSVRGGATPEGVTIPGRGPESQQSLSTGQGLGFDERVGQLSDAEFDQLANKPYMWKDFFGVK